LVFVVVFVAYISRMLVLLLQRPGLPIMTAFSTQIAASTGHWTQNLFPPRNKYKFLQSFCVISSQSSLLDPLDHPHWSLFSTISWLQSQDHRPLLSVCRPSLVKQASCYSSCSLSVRSLIIMSEAQTGAKAGTVAARGCLPPAGSPKLGDP